MGTQSSPYESAFADYLGDRGIPFIVIEEAKKALLPAKAVPRAFRDQPEGEPVEVALKSFDFVIYGEHRHLLIEVKGRKVSASRPRTRVAASAPPSGADAAVTADPARPSDKAAILAPSRLQSWVTLDDVESLANWQHLFGLPFLGVFAFVYLCETADQAAVIGENFSYAGKRYAIRLITVDDYRATMKPRSPKWGTVNLSATSFQRLSRPLSVPSPGPYPGRAAALAEPQQLLPCGT